MGETNLLKLMILFYAIELFGYLFFAIPFPFMMIIEF